MKVINREGKLLIPSCIVANTAWSRMVGLLLHKSLGQGQGLWLEPGNSIHSFFMRFAIDAVFIDKKGKVLRIYENFKPWRLSWIHWQARSVLELATGEAARLGIRQGEVLRLCKEA